MKCTLCGDEKEDLAHLELYVIGSEGIEACFNCRMILTKVAEGIRSTAGRVKLMEKKK